VTKGLKTIFFFFFFNICHTTPSFKIIAHTTHVWYISHMTFHSLPFEPRKIVATEARLNKIYEAAKLGLKGDALALASGMLPTEYRQLCELDPIADMAALKGKADGELEMSMCLHKAAKEAGHLATLTRLGGQAVHQHRCRSAHLNHRRIAPSGVTGDRCDRQRAQPTLRTRDTCRTPYTALRTKKN
jgi:hypothetical protein